MKKSVKLLVCFAIVLLCVACAVSSSVTASAASGENQKWVAAWGTAPAKVNMNGMSAVGTIMGDATVRVVLNPTASGDKLKIKFSNHYGKKNLKIEGVTVALAARETDGSYKSKIDVNSLRIVTFKDGSPNITIPPGAEVYSDIISLPVEVDKPITISMFYNEYQDVGTMGLAGATSYFTTGNQIQKDNFDLLPSVFDEKEMLDIMSQVLAGFTGSGTIDVKLAYDFITFVPAIASVDVLTDASGYSVVIAGDSTVANDFPEYLAQAIYQQDNINNVGIVGKGLVGNRLLGAGLGLGENMDGESLLTRFDRDVLGQSGVEYVIVKIGANDIIYPVSADALSDYPGIKQPTAEDIINGYRKLIKACHDADVKIVFASITQWKGNNRDYFGEGVAQYNRTEEQFQRDWQIAKEVNSWLATTTEHDGFINLTEISASSNSKDTLDSKYSTDGMNPSEVCQRMWANYFPRSLIGIGEKTGGVRIEDKEVSLFAGQEKQLVAIVVPETAVDKAVTWDSSNPEVATVDENGLVKAVSSGKAVITCKTISGGFTASCTINVTTKPESVMLSYTEKDIYTTKTLKLEAIVSPENADDKSVKWTSSNTKVATVDQSGKVTGVGTGSATITATTKVGGVSAICIVNVIKKVEVDSITITSNGEPITKKTLYINDNPKTVFEHYLSPTNATVKDVVWSSSDPKIVSVDQFGNVKGLAEGVATIRCTSEDNPYKVGTCTVYVKVKVTGVKISKSELSLVAGKTATLSAEILPADASNKNLTWSSSDESIATVDKNGKVKAVKAGTAYITVKAGNGKFSSVCKVTVTRIIYSQSIKLDKTKLTLDDGKKYELTATVYPDSTTNKKLTWSSSDTKVAKVDSYGEVTAVAPGTAYIYCKANDSGVTVKCKVTVKEVKLTSISFSSGSTTIEYSKTKTLKPTFKPSNATDKSLTWTSSDPKVVSVDKNGKIKGLVAGKSAVITAKAQNGKLVATIKVKVNPIGVSSVSLNRSSQTLSKGKTFTLTATVKPANATNKTLTWTSSNPSVATVDKNGKVTAVKNGTATITCSSANGKTATCTVTVKKIAVSNITLGQRELNMQVGSTFNLTATITPGNATNQTIKWTSSDKNVAKVSSTGKVTAVSEGYCQITATTADGGLTAVCGVEVIS